MERNKISNFVIILLITVNIFLGILVALDRTEKRKIADDAEDDVKAVLTASGIEVAPEVNFKHAAPVAYIQRRSQEAEEKIVSAAVGQSKAEDVGGNIIEYSGEGGIAYFHGTGDFTIELDSGPETDGVDNVLAYLDSIGIEGYYDERGGVEKAGDEITAVSVYMSRPVYNARIRITCPNGRIAIIEGVRVLDELRETQPMEILSMPTVVMRFLEAAREQEAACGRLMEIELGLKIETQSADGGMLVPVWRFVTDAGDFFINGVSGRMEPFAS